MPQSPDPRRRKSGPRHRWLDSPPTVTTDVADPDREYADWRTSPEGAAAMETLGRLGWRFLQQQRAQGEEGKDEAAHHMSGS